MSEYQIGMDLHEFGAKKALQDVQGLESKK
jgi:hypothetical protein